jgi:hypothetical protein
MYHRMSSCVRQQVALAYGRRCVTSGGGILRSDGRRRVGLNRCADEKIRCGGNRSPSWRPKGGGRAAGWSPWCHRRWRAEGDAVGATVWFPSWMDRWRLPLADSGAERSCGEAQVYTCCFSFFLTRPKHQFFGPLRSCQPADRNRTPSLLLRFIFGLQVLTLCYHLSWKCI